MGHNDHIDFDLHEQIEDLVHCSMLEEGSVPYGIAQKVIHDGYDSLTQNQRYHYDTFVVPKLIKRAEQVEVAAKIASWPD